MKSPYQVFVGFAAEDRYLIAEPIVYHLKNYGIPTWYDRHRLLLGDNHKEKCMINGAGKSTYACIVISQHTKASTCAMEENDIVRSRFMRHEITVFPILYELKPPEIPPELQWIRGIIFKEVSKDSGTREICNHIACRISSDILCNLKWTSLLEIVSTQPSAMSPSTHAILCSYLEVDQSNLNSRVSLLYAAFLSITKTFQLPDCVEILMVNKIFFRLFSETKLNLPIDYRELWLLENSICILINYCFADNTVSRI